MWTFASTVWNFAICLRRRFFCVRTGRGFLSSARKSPHRRSVRGYLGRGILAIFWQSERSGDELLDQIGTAGFIAKVHIPAALRLSIRLQQRAEPMVTLFKDIESIMPASRKSTALDWR
jgi:hypothetical protein